MIRECKLLPSMTPASEVAKKWHPAFLGSAQWFYKDEDFPVVQCVWPHKNQRYPWDKGFDKKFQGRQLLLVSNTKAKELGLR